jgi:hypothetical protein
MQKPLLATATALAMLTLVGGCDEGQPGRVVLSGGVQKGPFVVGSSVSVAPGS